MKKYTLPELLEIVATLRSENGCPWDREQTHESMKVCLIEECGEVIEAIDNKDDENLIEELGDVFLQVLMHSQIASEEKRFNFDDVVQVVAEKMIRRHPHVFGDAKAGNSQEALMNWKDAKALEKEKKKNGGT